MYNSFGWSISSTNFNINDNDPCIRYHPLFIIHCFITIIHYPCIRVPWIIMIHVISYHIIPYHIIPYIVSYRIISYHIISYHIISYHPSSPNNHLYHPLIYLSILSCKPLFVDFIVLSHSHELLRLASAWSWRSQQSQLLDQKGPMDM